MKRVWVFICVAGLTLGRAAQAQTVADLREMSIGQLEQLSVSSVTKSREPLSSAPASIYVITHDEIVRSGAATLPQILRLAPNLQVYEISASQFYVTARGLNGSSADQNFPNKLLVLIDGRSVYSPLYSGVYWDMQNVPPEDIARIEVISGPGATLWGANAVNGVINIVTRRASQTQGALVHITAGNLEQTATLQYGGNFDDDLAYRAYVRDYIGEDTQTASGANAHNHWQEPQGGFRLDWSASGADTVTLEGDDFAGNEAALGAPNEDISGRNLTAHWDHDWGDGSSLKVLAYYDREERADTDDGGRFWVDAYDLEVQHNFSFDDRNAVVWGGGLRDSRYEIDGTPSLYFVPGSKTLGLADVFAQDSIALSPTVTAILGLKLEEEPFSGLSPLPNARLSWRATQDLTLWTAVSRAIRSPTPFDTTVHERVGPISLDGDPGFEPEELTAYEIGARFQPSDRLSFSLSGYYDWYTDLRSIDEAAPPMVFPLTWGNNLKGQVYGVEAWANFQLLPWWRLSGSVTELNEQFSFAPQATAMFLGVEQLGDDPKYTASLQSTMNLGSGITWDNTLRYVDKLPAPLVPAYVELNSSIGWSISDNLRIALSGFNLLHARHQEFPAPADAVPRSFSIDVLWHP